LDCDEFDEVQVRHRLSSNPNLALAMCWYLIFKLEACLFAGDYARAVKAASEAQRLVWTATSYFEGAEYHFYAALSRALICDLAPAEQRQPHVDALAAHHQQLQVWEANCAENFENSAALVGAEIARIERRELDAECLYEKAIRSARTNGFMHNEALANELAARFYAARGLETLRTHICEMPVTAISAGGLTEKCGNSIGCILTSSRSRQYPLLPRRSRRRLKH
jgi:hypothetical protein